MGYQNQSNYKLHEIFRVINAARVKSFAGCFRRHLLKFSLCLAKIKMHVYSVTQEKSAKTFNSYQGTSKLQYCQQKNLPLEREVKFPLPS